jgi:hypothetical protein
MRLIFNDNAAYEHFQFFWYALSFGGRLDSPHGRLKLEQDLRFKLAAISRENPDGGRVLWKPCSLEFSDEERLAIAECITGTSWTDAAFPAAVRALQFLGVDVEFLDRPTSE